MIRMVKWFTFALLLAHPATHGQGVASVESAKALIRDMSSKYREAQSSIVITAHLSRHHTSGVRSREWQRELRLVQGASAVRAEVRDRSGISKGLESIMYLRRGSQIALYISTNKQFARLNAGEPEAEAIQEALARIQLALFSRFADLAGTDYVVSSIKDADLKLGGVKRSCHQIRLKSPATDKPGWNAEIWIEKGSKFVRRASLLKNEDGGLLEEVLDFIELRSGKDAAAALTDLDWEPPAGAVPFERVPKGPLPQ